jgi:hypothetical protein
LDVRETARGIVERALLATVKDFDPATLPGWEVALLGSLLNAKELSEFLERVFRGFSDSGGNPGELQFIHQRGSLPLLQSPVSVVIQLVEQPLRKVDYQARLKAGDPAAWAEYRARTEGLLTLRDDSPAPRVPPATEPG